MTRDLENAHPHICVVGSLNVDFVTRVSRCPGPGETITAKSLSVTVGGKGANQAVACARASFMSKERQDVKVTMIGAVGLDDSFYSTLLRPALEASGVVTEYIHENNDCQTGSATIIVEDEERGENRILVVPGANHSGMLDINAILQTIDSQQEQCRFILMQGEIPKATVVGILRAFNRPTSSTHVIFNPAPVFPGGISIDAISHTSVIVVNETEMIQLSEELATFSVLYENETHNPEKFANCLHTVAQVKVVLITLGKNGVFYSTINGKSGRVPGVAVESVVDTTAAGDTFVGYFACEFAKMVTSTAKLSDLDSYVEEMVATANKAASFSVQKSGAMQSIPFAYEINAVSAAL
jgi:ribokinase